MTDMDLIGRDHALGLLYDLVDHATARGGAPPWCSGGATA
jgi:hypothetical protein